METENTDASCIQLEVMDTTSAAAAEERKIAASKVDEPKNGTVINNHKDEMNGENDERKTAIRLCKTGKSFFKLNANLFESIYFCLTRHLFLVLNFSNEVDARVYWQNVALYSSRDL